MSNYTKSTNFATKDNLTPGDPLKVVRGTEIDTEYNNIATAIATKTDNASAAITGGTITGITDLAVADGGTGASTATAALNNLLPTQTGNANKYLQTDGTNATWDAVTLSTADITGTLPVANGGTGVTSSTGTGSVVLSNSPTLVTPVLGTPASGTATNLTGLPISTGVSGLGTGVATFLGTPSSANLASAVSDETGSGALVFANSPTLVTPALGTPSALVGTNITGTASGLTAGNVTTNANLTGAVTSVGNATSLGSFSSANLLGALTDETGTGSAVFANTPTLVTPILGTPTSATLTNATGLPIATGVSGLGTGVATFLATPSSANLAAALTDETGSGSAVFATSPTLVTPALGTPSSGVVTNLTGTASININGTVGATTPTTGGFTNVTAQGAHGAGSFNAYIIKNTASAGASGKISWQGSTGTESWAIAQDQTIGATSLEFNYLGANKAVFDSSGNLGLGVGSPLAKIDVSKTSVDAISRTNAVGALGDFVFGAGLLMQQTLSSPYGFALQAANAANTTQYPLLLQPSGGNLGIGTSSPAGKVSILQSASATPALITDVTNAVGSIWQRFTSASSANQYMDIVLRSGNEVEFNTSSKDISLINHSTFLVKSSGNVGIGTSSPQKLLELSSSSNPTIRLSNTETAAVANDVIGTLEYYSFDNDGAHIGAYVKAIQDPVDIYGRATALTFGTNAVGVAVAERMRLDASGNLLVGSTSTSGTNAPTAITVAGRLRSVAGTTASIANGLTVDIALTMPRAIVSYFIMGDGNSGYQSAGFFRANDNGASSTYVLFSQSENGVAVTSPSSGIIRITNNTGTSAAFNYAFTVLSGT